MNLDNVRISKVLGHFAPPLVLMIVQGVKKKSTIKIFSSDIITGEGVH